MHSLLWCGALSGDRRYRTFELCYSSLVVRGQVANDSKETVRVLVDLYWAAFRQVQILPASVSWFWNCSAVHAQSHQYEGVRTCALCWKCAGWSLSLMASVVACYWAACHWRSHSFPDRLTVLNLFTLGLKFALTQLLTRQTSAWGSEDISHFTQVHSRPCFFPSLCFHCVYTWVWIRW